MVNLRIKKWQILILWNLPYQRNVSHLPIWTLTVPKKYVDVHKSL